MNLKCLGVLFAAAVMLPTGASAASLNQGSWNMEKVQLPPPFGPSPIIPGRQCSPQYQKLLKLQIEGLQRLQGLTRDKGERLCVTIEGADQLGIDKLIDPKALPHLLRPEQREFLEALGVDLSKLDIAKLMRSLGVDISKIDLRQVKEQCRQSQRALDPFATDELGRVENEIIRCDDRI